jgi:hypothetical protein
MEDEMPNKSKAELDSNRLDYKRSWATVSADFLPGGFVTHKFHPMTEVAHAVL